MRTLSVQRMTCGRKPSSTSEIQGRVPECWTCVLFKKLTGGVQLCPHRGADSAHCSVTYSPQLFRLLLILSFIPFASTQSLAASQHPTIHRPANLLPRKAAQMPASQTRSTTTPSSARPIKPLRPRIVVPSYWVGFNYPGDGQQRRTVRSTCGECQYLTTCQHAQADFDKQWTAAAAVRRIPSTSDRGL